MARDGADMSGMAQTGAASNFCSIGDYSFYQWLEGSPLRIFYDMGKELCGNLYWAYCHKRQPHFLFFKFPLSAHHFKEDLPVPQNFMVLLFSHLANLLLLLYYKYNQMNYINN